MAKRFETQEDLDRERKAIELFAKHYKVKPVKLGEYDIDFLCTRNGIGVMLVEVKGKKANTTDIKDFVVAQRKFIKLSTEAKKRRVLPVLIWACYDGIVVCENIHLANKTSYFGGRKPRKGSANDREEMLRYDYFDNEFKMYLYEEV